MPAVPIMEILGIIASEYPDAVSILEKPGVAQVYVDYVNSKHNWPEGTEPWTEAHLQAALRQTAYYKETPKQVREWDILQATDPKTTQEQAEIVRRQVADLQRSLGVTLSTEGGLNSMSFQFLVNAVKYGWDANEIKYQLLASVNKGTTGGGDLGTQAANVKKMANDYGLPMSDKRVMAYASQMLQGAIDPEALQGDLIMQAKSLYPTIGDQLDRGQTVREFADPYLQLAERELGVDPNSVDLTDQRWIKMLNSADPKTGERQPMTMDSWLSTIRSDPTYNYSSTAQGKQSATTLAAQLQAKMGASA